MTKGRLDQIWIKRAKRGKMDSAATAQLDEGQGTAVSACALEDSRGRVLVFGECRIAFRGETKPCEQMEEALPGLRGVMFGNWGGGAIGEVVGGGTVRVGDVVRWDDES